MERGVVALGTTATSAVLLVALLACSAFFSSTEIAVFSLSPEWLAERATGGDARARTLADLHENPHRLLVTLLVGNDVVNVAISSILAVLLAERFSGGLAVAVTTLVGGSVVLVFGEILPKAYGLGHAEEWALRTARPVRVVQRLLWPIVVVFDLVTRRAGAATAATPTSRSRTPTRPTRPPRQAHPTRQTRTPRARTPRVQTPAKERSDEAPNAPA